MIREYISLKLLEFRARNVITAKAIAVCMETLEFIIYPDGRVKETVTGIVGSSCQEVTAAIEEQLGVVVSTSQTSDYYAQETIQSSKVATQSNYSDW